jgi:hypothetical protein
MDGTFGLKPITLHPNAGFSEKSLNINLLSAKKGRHAFP